MRASGYATVTTCPAGTVTTCPAGTVTLVEEDIQIGAVEQVPKEEWKLVKPKGRQSDPMEADPSRLESTGAPQSDLDSIRLIQSLTDSTFDSATL